MSRFGPTRLLLCLIPLSLLACCSPSSENRLIGKWQTESGGANWGFSYVFNGDGTMKRASSAGARTQGQTGTWKMIESNGDDLTVQFTLDTGRGGTTTEEVTITFSDSDHMRLVPVGAGQLADQMAQECRRVSR